MGDGKLNIHIIIGITSQNIDIYTKKHLKESKENNGEDLTSQNDINTDKTPSRIGIIVYCIVSE